MDRKLYAISLKPYHYAYSGMLELDLSMPEGLHLGKGASGPPRPPVGPWQSPGEG